MARHHVVLFWHLVTERDFIRFGREAFERRGYHCRFVSCWQAIHKGETASFESSAFSNHPEAVSPTSRDELLDFLDTLTLRDFILVNIPLAQETFWIFEALSRRGLPYSVMWLAKYPSYFPYRFGGAGEILRSLLTWLVATRRLAERIRMRLCLILSQGRSYFRVNGPQFYIRAGSYELWCYPDAPKVWHGRPLDVGSFELLWARLGVEHGEGRVPNYPYALFLDEAMGHHPDWIIGGGRPDNMPAINADIRKALDKIERDTGLKVVVALHPKSDYSPEGFAEVYGGRTAIKNNTAALISKARFVIGHQSTSFTMAVIFDKPAVFLTNRHIRASRDGLYVDFLAAWLGTTPIDMELFNRDGAPAMAAPTVDKRRYRQFIHTFVRAPGAPDVPIWDYVADQFEAAAH